MKSDPAFESPIQFQVTSDVSTIARLGPGMANLVSKWDRPRQLSMLVSRTGPPVTVSSCNLVTFFM